MLEYLLFYYYYVWNNILLALILDYLKALNILYHHYYCSKKNVTNITILLIPCLNALTSRLIWLWYRKFIRDGTKSLKINLKKLKEHIQILILIQESRKLTKKKVNDDYIILYHGNWISYSVEITFLPN